MVSSVQQGNIYWNSKFWDADTGHVLTQELGQDFRRDFPADFPAWFWQRRMEPCRHQNHFHGAFSKLLQWPGWLDKGACNPVPILCPNHVVVVWQCDMSTMPKVWTLQVPASKAVDCIFIFEQNSLAGEISQLQTRSFSWCIFWDLVLFFVQLISLIFCEHSLYSFLFDFLLF